MSSLQIYLNNLMGMIIKRLNKTLQIKENNFYELESYLRGKVSVAGLGTIDNLKEDSSESVTFIRKIRPARR